MKHKNIPITVLILFLSITRLIAQDEQTGLEKIIAESWEGNFRPFIEADYGVGKSFHLDFKGEFNWIGAGGAKLGYSKIKKIKKAIVSIDERYLFGSYASKDLWMAAGELDTNKVNTEMWRFGIGNRLGYGYRIGPISLLPSHQFQFVWSQLKFSRPQNLVVSDINILDRYEGSTRFGVSTEGGAKIELFKSLAASVSYEAEVVYPRFLGLKWVGSVLVQTFGIGAISVFAEDIVNSSPVFGPIMYMLLRNGAGYGFYYLMKYNSYWPIKSEKPLTNETFKIGASITF